MLPVSLRLKGIYSYRDNNEQVIDFETLTQDHLFGIFGAVGSGKSTILEAITFALYGDIERMNSKENRGYNMMNMRSTEMLIDFQFKAGINQDLYRFTVKSKRNSKNFLQVGTPERLAYQWKNNDWEPMESADGGKVLGISYENFKRTIIIPQGKFQEFIQLSATERTKMMKELFNLEKFDYAQTTREKINHVKTQLTYLEGELTGLGSITPADIEEKEQQLSSLSVEKTKLETQKLHKETLLKEQIELKERFEELIIRKKEFDILIGQQAIIQQKETVLNQYERTKERYSGVIHDLKRLRDELVQLTNQLQQNQQRQTLLKQELQQLIHLESTVKEVLGDKEKQLQKANELISIARIKELQSKEVQLSERIKNGENASQLKKADFDAITKRKEEILLKREQLHQNKPDHELLAHLTDWFSKQQQLQTELAGSQTFYQQKITEKADLTNLFTQKVIARNLTLSSIDELKNTIFSRKEQLGSHKTQLLNKQIEVKSQEKLAEFAHNLTDGEACPLCGSTHHPNLYAAHNGSEIKLSIENELKTIDTEITDLNALEIETKSFSENYHRLSTQENEIYAGLKAKEEALTVHAQLFNFNGFSPDKPEQVNEIRSSIKNWELQRDQLDTEQAETDKQLSLISEELKKYETAIIKIKNDLAETNGSINTLLQGILILNPEDYRSYTAEALQLESNQLTEKLSKAQTEFDLLTQQLEVKNGEVNLVTGVIEHANDQSHQLQLQLDNTNQRLIDLLKEDNNRTEGEVISILSHNLNTESLRSEISDYKQRFVVAQERVQNIRQLIADKIYDDVLYQQLQSELNEVISDFTNVSNQLAELKVTIETGKKALIRIAELNNQREQLQNRKSQLDVLDKLFKANGFERFISVVYLRNLCFAANERFMKFSRNQLSLELNEETETFVIRDNLNNGQVRSVKTLSGGQTFQAALSLALALADNIQQFNQGNQNFFFLDEGFGSLDKDSLHHVFETLKSLRKENRIVGLISHVDDMQQEIANYLKVTNSEETGSVIVTSWEE